MTHPINELTETAMNKIRDMVDANTIVGSPITTEDGTVLIPVSKVAFGFGSGGTDYDSKGTQLHFGGGSGGGVTVTPVCFLVVSGGNVRMLPVTGAQSTQVDRIVDIVPGIVDKVAELFGKGKKEDSVKNKEE